MIMDMALLIVRAVRYKSCFAFLASWGLWSFSGSQTDRKHPESADPMFLCCILDMFDAGRSLRPGPEHLTIFAAAGVSSLSLEFFEEAQ